MTMRTQRKNHNTIKVNRKRPRYIVVDGKQRLKYRNISGVKEYIVKPIASEVESPTPEQLQIMNELGHTSLTEAREHAWQEMPISSAAFRILFIDLANNQNRSPKTIKNYARR